MINFLKVNDSRKGNCVLLLLCSVEHSRFSRVVDDAILACLDILGAVERIEVYRDFDILISQVRETVAPNSDSLVIAKPHLAVCQKAPIPFLFEGKRQDGVTAMDEKDRAIWRDGITTIVSVQSVERRHASLITPTGFLVKEVAS